GLSAQERSTFYMSPRPWFLSQMCSSHSTNANANSLARSASACFRRNTFRRIKPQPGGEIKTKIVFAFYSPLCYISPRRFQQVLDVLPLDLRYLLSTAC